MNKQDYHAEVLALGGGAAGIMCAIQAGLRGRKVIILERATRAGVKVLLAGGGKCNFTNRQCRAENYLSQNPHFCKSALAQFRPDDFIAMLEAYNVRYEQRGHGRLFCLTSSKFLMRMLDAECQRAGVQLHLGCQIEAVRKDKCFSVQTNLGIYTAESLVVATGGLSYPKKGATDLGYRLARQFDLAVTPCRAGLVPLTYNAGDYKRLADLSGISLATMVYCNGQEFDDFVLFTHRGLSGPAILQISNYWKYGDTITIDWLPEIDVYDLLVSGKHASGGATARSVLGTQLPHRMLQKWNELYFPQKPLAECSLAQLQQAADSVNRWSFRPQDTEGYDKAEVTLGGIDTTALSSHTLEVRHVKGLYFIGEVVDVTGHLGGYNLQWGWSSGFAAGCVV